MKAITLDNPTYGEVEDLITEYGPVRFYIWPDVPYAPPIPTDRGTFLDTARGCTVDLSSEGGPVEAVNGCVSLFPDTILLEV